MELKSANYLEINRLCNLNINFANGIVLSFVFPSCKYLHCSVKKEKKKNGFALILNAICKSQVYITSKITKIAICIFLLKTSLKYTTRSSNRSFDVVQFIDFH